LYIHVWFLEVLVIENTFFEIEVSFNCSLGDREVRGRVSYLVKLELPQDLFSNRRHHGEVVEQSQTLQHMTNLKGIVEGIF